MLAEATAEDSHGLLCSKMLQACRLGTSQHRVAPQECKDTQVFCQPPPPEPAFSVVPTQRSLDPQPVITQIVVDEVENLYSIWEVVSVVPETLPLNDSAPST